ncbi:MAG: hypothetical protein L6R36_003986 [Xanthoria steineri]|nr:MAG: hypothetical protein L6R36_003986 [Xanthoria steineri]
MAYELPKKSERITTVRISAYGRSHHTPTLRSRSKPFWQTLLHVQELDMEYGTPMLQNGAKKDAAIEAASTPPCNINVTRCSLVCGLPHNMLYGHARCAANFLEFMQPVAAIPIAEEARIRKRKSAIESRMRCLRAPFSRTSRPET